MKKILPILIVGLLFLSGFGAVAIQDVQEQDEQTFLTESVVMDIAAPIFIEDNGFVRVNVQDSTQLISSGKPMVPMFTKTFTFPVGTRIEETSVSIEYQTVQLDSKVVPSPAPAPYSSDVYFESGLHDDFDSSVYESSALYPTEPYEVKYLTGINEGEQVTYVTVRCFAQYSPAEDYINIPQNIQYTITHEEPVTSLFSQAAYDLLIVTDVKFEDEMLRLKNHKDSIGMRTRVVTVDTILDMGYDGVADWEEVKLFLADERVNNGVNYVLFAGGKRAQTNGYWVPAFVSQNFDGAVDGQGNPYDLTYLSDLYFADLFELDQYGNPSYSTWDPNGDGDYAVGPYYEDYDRHIDYVPDVYFGRIPLRYSWEATTVVDKIIEYENMPAGQPWFNKGVFLGGDTSPAERYPGVADEGIYEGELICDVGAGHLESIGWETYKMYMSDAGDHILNDGVDGSAADEVADVLSQGAGWLQGQSHANPAVMGNHPPDSNDFIYYFTIMDMNLFTSNGKYPFMVLDGCTNGFWDASIQRIIDAGGAYPGIHGLKWIPTDISSWMVLRENGGSIASIGNTALGYGYLNAYCTEGLGGWVSPRFAHAFAVQGRDRIGEIWVQGITDYITTFDVNTDDVQRKTIEERGLLGDPSIKIGGVGGGAFDSDGDESTDDAVYVPAETMNAPVWNVGDSWSYNLNSIDFVMQELEDRGIDLKLSAGTIDLEVVESRAFTYVTEVSCDDIDVAIELIFNSYTDEPTIFEVPMANLENVQLQGMIIWEKDTLAIEDVELSLFFDIMDNIENNEGLLEEFGVVLPGFIYSLIPFMSIPVQIDLSVGFENPWPLFQFPFEEGKEWGIPEGLATVTIGGSMESIWLRILSIVNNIIPLIPADFAKYLPNVDIAEVLEDFGIPTVMELEIPYVAEVMRKAPFAVSGQEMVNVGAGSFSATRIKILGGIGNLYYSDEVNNFVQISSPASEFLPAINNINLELIE